MMAVRFAGDGADGFVEGGHHLYSWNSGFWWLHREVRARLGLKGDDALAANLDRELGVGHRDGFLVLESAKAKLRPPANN